MEQEKTESTEKYDQHELSGLVVNRVKWFEGSSVETIDQFAELSVTAAIELKGQTREIGQLRFVVFFLQWPR